MPWEENNTMDQRMRFLVEWQHGLESKAELCRRYGIAPAPSKKSGCERIESRNSG